ncbi:MAG: hypothetical protein KGL39_04865 [Patescibacteria group bacterium]|nr:hypothetical protein [Patescibacteria group bacterium]
MKKIPTLFVRDWAGDKSRVVNIVADGCEWVADGQGVATRKVDGTCCMIRDGRMYRRRELKSGEITPALFESSGLDKETGKTVGWVPVGDGPEDRWHREAFNHDLADGTYELLGPKVQGNPEGTEKHVLVRHGGVGMAGELGGVPRDFAGLREWLSQHDVEGIVFHHEDGRMAKIKARDFGIKRGRP